MARLPQPATRSPGFLELQYTTGGIHHKVRQRYLAGVDPTDETLVGAEAATWLAAIIQACNNTVRFTAFRSLNPDGIEYFTGLFESGNVGTLSLDGALASDSASMDFVGRGAPGGGLAQGNTRHMWFPGIYPGNATEPTMTGNPPQFWDDLRDFLNNSAVVGADFYGSKAVFPNVINLQFNAHYQKRYGR